MEEINAKRDYGYNYSYLSLNYIKLKDYKNALDIILAHLKNIDDIKVDVKNGLIYIAIGILLGNKNKLINMDEKLSQIHKFIKIPLEADNYFKLAIEKTKSSANIQNHIISLYEYGNYLYRKGKNLGEEVILNLGIQNLSLAKKKAGKIGVVCEIKKIDEILKNNNITIY